MTLEDDYDILLVPVLLFDQFPGVMVILVLKLIQIDQKQLLQYICLKDQLLVNL